MTRSLVAVIAAGAVAALVPARALLLVDLDRTVRPLGPALDLVARLAVGAAAVALATAVGWACSGNRRLELRRAASAWWRRPDTPLHAAVLVVLLAIAVWLRWPSMSLPTTYDEAISVVWFSSRGWLDVVSDHTIPNNHVFHNLLVKGVTAGAGLTVQTVRLPAFAAGLLCVPLAYWLTSRLWRPESGLLAAAVTAAAPVAAEYSTQARGYTLLWVCFLAAFVAATHLRERDGTRPWACLAVATALGLWTIPTMVYGSATIALWLLGSVPAARRREVIVRGVVWGGAAGALAGLLYLPALLRTGLHQTPGPLSNVWTYVQLPREWTTGLPWPFLLLLSAGTVVALARAQTRLPALTLLGAAAIAHAGLLVTGKAPPNRVLYYLFFVAAGIACHGTVLLLARTSRSAWQRGVVPALSVVLASAWALAWVAHTRQDVDAGGVTWVQGKVPGAEGIRCCSNGYFIDAESLVADLAPRLQDGDAIVAEDLVGAVETLRFYLVASGRSPTLVHPYQKARGREQLAPYADLFVVVKGDDYGPPEDEYRTTMLRMLGIEDEELRRVYAAPERIATHRISRVYHVRRREPRRPEEIPAKMPFNMFWYW